MFLLHFLNDVFFLFFKLYVISVIWYATLVSRNNSFINGIKDIKDSEYFIGLERLSKDTTYWTYFNAICTAINSTIFFFSCSLLFFYVCCSHYDWDSQHLPLPFVQQALLHHVAHTLQGRPRPVCLHHPLCYGVRGLCLCREHHLRDPHLRLLACKPRHHHHVPRHGRRSRL